jgi:SWI/SNF-related matrix-associated actin-dependent regulator 1 of chromatin subfamily A
LGIILTCREGRFFATALPAALPRAMRDRWTKSRDGEYSTEDLRAAVTLREYSDDKAREIFNRLFVRSYDFPKTPPSGWEKLDSHQKEGVRWILTRSRSYLAHAPGAGKTIETIVATNGVPPGGLYLVVCPPLLVGNWEREIRKWSIDPDSFLVCADTQLAKNIDKLVALPLRLVAFDEASRFKEWESLRTQLVARLLRTFPPLAVFLDGSPMPNRPMEWWAPTWIMAPEAIDFRSQREFGFRYCGPRVNDRGQYEFKWASNSEELHRKLTRTFVHVVTEEQLEHPERRRRILFMNEDVRTARMRKWEERNLPKIDLSRGLRALENQSLAEHCQQLGIRKVRWAAQYVHQRILQGDRILVFFWHRAVGHDLAARIAKVHFGSVPYIDGDTPMIKREEMFRQFQCGRSQVIIGNIQAMGRGVNLQKATRIIFVEFAWTDETNKQAEKRASRRGSRRLFVPCDYLCAPDSVDEPRLRVLFRKQRLVKSIVKPREEE